MSQRLDYKTLSPEGYRAMAGLSRFVGESGLDKSLIHLVKLRVSQINGCAYCCWLHSKDLRAAGVKQAHIDVLPAWREASGYSAQERAALAWAEAVTLISETPCAGRRLSGSIEAVRRQADGRFDLSHHRDQRVESSRDSLPDAAAGRLSPACAGDGGVQGVDARRGTVRVIPHG